MKKNFSFQKSLILAKSHDMKCTDVAAKMRNKQWKQKKNPSKTLFSGYNQFKEVSFRYIQTLEFITTKYLSTNNNNILLNCILGIGSRVQSHENLIENAMVFFELRVISSSFICKKHVVAKSFIMKWKSNYVGTWWFQEKVNLSWFIWLMI